MSRTMSERCTITQVVMQAIGEHLRQRPELLPQTLSTLFEVVLFEDCTNQWSMSRPMLSLILLNEQIYNELKHRIIASQPVRRCSVPEACMSAIICAAPKGNVKLAFGNGMCHEADAMALNMHDVLGSMCLELIGQALSSRLSLLCSMCCCFHNHRNVLHE